MEATINQTLLSTENVKPQDKPFQIHDTKLKGFVLRVQPSGHMTYNLIYKGPSGKKQTIKIGTTKEVNATVARDRAKELSADVIKGFDPAAKKKEARANSLTIKDYIDQYYNPYVESEQRFRSGKATIARLKSAFKDYNKLLRKIAGNIRSVREEKNLTQEDMEDLGFGPRWYQRFESGRHTISLPTLHKLAKAFSVDIRRFFD